MEKQSLNKIFRKFESSWEGDLADKRKSTIEKPLKIIKVELGNI